MTAPRDLPYTITGRDLVSQIQDLRVQILTLSDGECIPWHFHSTVYDIFVCLQGITRIKTRGPDAQYLLAAGEHCTVAPNTAHEVSCQDTQGCKFVLVQGIGAHDFNLAGNAIAADNL